MEIPVYTASEADNAITEGEFEIKGFRSFIQTIMDEHLYDVEKLDGLFDHILREGTAALTTDEMMALNGFISQYNSVCQRCGNDFTWDEMDPKNEVVYCSDCQHDLARSAE